MNNSINRLSAKTTILLVLICTLIITSYAVAQMSRKGNIKMDTSDSNKKDLKNILSEEQYHVAVDNGTESPFSNAYWDNKQEGIYVDIISGDPLFISTDKFNSGTGWPSFTRPINKDNIVETSDKAHGMIRTEVRNKNSNAHLGHVFTDGPAPTGQRYCINSASLRFIPADKLKEEGYSKFSESFINENKKDVKHTGTKEIATFGAGCFWGVEASFQNISGVLSTAVGYMGGNLIDPTYEEVCTKNTGHAEVVHVEFDPGIVSYRKLIETFWRIHNLTTLNRQGPDFGTQYRSVVFYHNEEQKDEAVKYKDELNKNNKYKGRIVTEIKEAAEFYRAEEYHQKYIQKKGGGSCKF